MRDNEALRRELAKKQEQSSSDEESDSDESRRGVDCEGAGFLGECVDEEEPGFGLLNMKFMVKAREAQRARARARTPRSCWRSSRRRTRLRTTTTRMARRCGSSRRCPATRPPKRMRRQPWRSRATRSRCAGSGARGRQSRRRLPMAPRRDEEGAGGRRRNQRPGARAPGSRRRAKAARAAAPCPRSTWKSSRLDYGRAPSRKRPKAAPVKEDAPLTKLSQQDLLHMAFDDKDQEDFAAATQRGTRARTTARAARFHAAGARGPARRRARAATEEEAQGGTTGHRTADGRRREPAVILNPKRAKKRACSRSPRCPTLSLHVPNMKGTWRGPSGAIGTPRRR